MSDKEKSVDNRIETALLLAIIAFGLSASHFVVSVWHAEKTDQRLQRIEKIVGIDEIGRRK